ncbi:MAG: hypothetical protein AB8F78_00745 [Saprospiraceae bacterium]
MSNTYLDIPAQADVLLSPNPRLLSVIPASTTASARDMLEKIFLACGLNPADEASTFECFPPQAVAVSIPSGAAGLRIAVFGLSPKQIGAQWAILPYQWLKIGDHYWCFAERLEDIEADIEKKKRLWGCLKILKES